MRSMEPDMTIRERLAGLLAGTPLTIELLGLAVFAPLAQQQSHRAAARQLQAMSDRELLDLGIGRCEIAHAVGTSGDPARADS